MNRPGEPEEPRCSWMQRTVDQRGFARPDHWLRRGDAGAFEFGEAR